MAKKSQTTGKPKMDAKTIMEELKTPGLIIIGMVGGNLAGKMIDKVVKVDSTATGFHAKALVKPVVQITAGVGGALFLKDQNLKLIATGVAARIGESIPEEGYSPGTDRIRRIGRYRPGKTGFP